MKDNVECFGGKIKSIKLYIFFPGKIYIFERKKGRKHILNFASFFPFLRWFYYLAEFILQFASQKKEEENEKNQKTLQVSNRK